MTDNNGNAHRKGFLRSLLDAIFYLGRGLFAQRDPENLENDIFYDSEDTGVNLEKGDETNGNGKPS
ncbi:MAG: hypothetical protein KME64_32030 [Scytonematopsis contorta HA4267-MV1]|jgi:hypothetical protein|nr:hypothetical protein [Scytonematopsis contorta HA4267-MV1]